MRNVFSMFYGDWVMFWFVIFTDDDKLFTKNLWTSMAFTNINISNGIVSILKSVKFTRLRKNYSVGIYTSSHNY